jgi:hypothetical protein
VRRRPTAVVAAVLAVFLVVATAIAKRSSLEDGNDTKGVLDIDVVHYDKVPDEPQSWTIVTIAPWRIGQLWDAGYVTIWFDTEGDLPADRYALIRSTGQRLEGTMMRVARQPGARDQPVGALHVWRKTNDGVSVRIPVVLLAVGPYRDSYRWWVVSSLTTAKCPATCLDRVPNDGAVDQPLPGASPSPSQSTNA